MRWLLMLGLSLDGAGAALIAWPVIRPGTEAKEEARQRWGGNPWMVVLRRKEQRYVQVGAMFLLAGFALQFAVYVRANWSDLALLAGIGVIVSAGIVLGGRLAARGLPMYRERKADSEIHDQRHVFAVSTAEDARRLMELTSLAKLGRSILALDAEVLARINHGRWVAECPQCRNDTIAWSENPRAFCLDDGVSFRVRFPEDRMMIESILLYRPMEIATGTWTRRWRGCGKKTNSTDFRTPCEPRSSSHHARGEQSLEALAGACCG